MTWCGKGV